jgi:hypothetical protein
LFHKNAVRAQTTTEQKIERVNNHFAKAKIQKDTNAIINNHHANQSNQSVIFTEFELAEIMKIKSGIYKNQISKSQ